MRAGMVFFEYQRLNGEPTERKTLDHVAYIRAHVVDLDNTLTAAANYERAVAAYGGSFAVQSSPENFIFIGGFSLMLGMIFSPATAETCPTLRRRPQNH